MNELRNQRVDLSGCRPGITRRFLATLAPPDVLRRIIATAADLLAERPPDVLVCHANRLMEGAT